MIALQQVLAEARSGTTVQRNSPAYTLQANGSAEKAVQDVTDLMRRLLLGLEAKMNCRVGVGLPIINCLVRHAAFVHNRYIVEGIGPHRLRGLEAHEVRLSRLGHRRKRARTQVGCSRQPA